MSIPSIQEIFSSDELSRVITVFADHLDATKKETEQLNALGIILRQLLNMLKDRQNMDSVYSYLDTNHSAESEELKAALKTVLAEPVKEIAIEAAPEAVVDLDGVDLGLETMTVEDTKMFADFDFAYQLKMPDCSYSYKIMQNGECIGAVNLLSAGMEAMLIYYLGYTDPDNNIYLFELLKQKHPDILCWNIYFPLNADCQYDREGKKRQFADDNGFKFYTDARWNRYIKMLKPHDEVYNSSRYRFAMLDGPMDGVAFRFFGADRMDWYDGKMTNWRVNECDFVNALIFSSWMGNTRIYESGLNGSAFQYATFDDSNFNGSSFKNCKIQNCDLTGLTIDGINVKDALEFYKQHQL